MSISIGIDPGKSTGYAISINKKLTMLATISFWECVDMLYEVPEESKPFCKVFIEDPNINRPIFMKPGVFKGKGSEKSEQLMMQKIAQNVGANKREASLLIELCNKLGIEVVPCQPTKKSMTKLNSEQFNKLTGWVGRTSSHSRDAGILVFGR